LSNNCVDPASPLVGQAAPPFFSALAPLSLKVASHLARSPEISALGFRTAFAWAFRRHELYLAEIFGYPASHLSAGDAARAAPPMSSTAIRAAHTPGLPSIAIMPSCVRFGSNTSGG